MRLTNFAKRHRSPSCPIGTPAQPGLHAGGVGARVRVRRDYVCWAYLYTGGCESFYTLSSQSVSWPPAKLANVLFLLVVPHDALVPIQSDVPPL